MLLQPALLSVAMMLTPLLASADETTNSALPAATTRPTLPRTPEPPATPPADDPLGGLLVVAAVVVIVILLAWIASRIGDNSSGMS
jgi:hypothetical protein